MADTDEQLSAYLTAQHREADARWAEVESAAQENDGARVRERFGRFERSMRRHLAFEEEVLFPEFESATGMTEGPTRVMRAEHAQMRALLEQMSAALAAADHERVLDGGDTLLTLMQQHNMKEEGMLYRMSEQVLAEVWPALRERAREYE